MLKWKESGTQNKQALISKQIKSFLEISLTSTSTTSLDL